MKSLIVYSSKSGNTKKLAKTIGDMLPGEKVLMTMEENPETKGYDLVCAGFWFQAGKPDAQSASFLSTVKTGKLFLFATHGAANDSGHAANGMTAAKTLASPAEIIGSFHCQGAVNAKFLEKAGTMDPPPPWIKDAPLAKGHPDADDIAALRKEIEAVLNTCKMK